MQTLSEVERQAMQLCDADRAALASHLLGALPAVLADDDEGLAEALRRDAELHHDPSLALSWNDLRRAIDRPDEH